MATTTTLEYAGEPHYDHQYDQHQYGVSDHPASPAATGSTTTTHAQIPAKRKRKQLVSCDPCRLRRVKCDRVDMVENADCSECAKKGITCTDDYVRNKPRTGIRSSKAAREFKAKSVTEAEEVTPTSTKSLVHSPASGMSSDERPGSSISSAPTPASSTTIIRAAEARFVNSEMARAISDHLVQAYHEFIQPHSTVLDWKAFSTSWDASGHNSEMMSAGGECLTLVIQAWGARFSDHPSLIGSFAPSSLSIKTSPIRDLSEYGQHRDGFARAMADRAFKAIDKRGVLRKPSVQGCTALVMLDFLDHWNDSNRSHGGHLLTSAVEHLRYLNEHQSADPAESGTDVVKSLSGALFWIAYTRDALSSAYAGRATALTNDDVSVLCEIATIPLTTNVLQFVSSNDPVTLCGLAVISMFRFITDTARTCTVQILGPRSRRTRLNIAAARDLWSDIARSSHYSAIFRESLRGCKEVEPTQCILWLRDLTSMRAQLSHALHQGITERFEAEYASQIEAADPDLRHYLESLRALKDEADERFLVATREVALRVREYGTNIIAEAGLSTEHLPAYLAHMIAMPVWEQGGMEDWTLAAKLEETSWIIDAVRIHGYCWADLSRHIDAATNSLAQLSAQAKIEQTRHHQQQQHQQHLQNQQVQQLQHDQHLQQHYRQPQQAPPFELLGQLTSHLSQQSQPSLLFPSLTAGYATDAFTHTLHVANWQGPPPPPLDTSVQFLPVSLALSTEDSHYSYSSKNGNGAGERNGNGNGNGAIKGHTNGASNLDGLPPFVAPIRLKADGGGGDTAGYFGEEVSGLYPQPIPFR